MIICRLEGGLGNQLFQYAAGRAIAHRLNARLKLDTSIYKRDPSRLYELDLFNIEATTLHPLYDKLFPLLPRRYAIAKGLRNAGLFPEMLSTDELEKCGDGNAIFPGLPSGMTLFHDRTQGFDDRFLSLTGDVYLQGFWQSERYFESIRDLIRRDLTFRFGPDARNAELLQKIRSEESIAIHVRRGDYVVLPSYAVCSLDYYRRAIDHVMPTVRAPHFFIFSDDPEWTRLNLKIDAPCTYVSHNTGNRNFEDLRLMQACRHFITANSSFSWWGAWLGQHPGKQVICPLHWYDDPMRTIRDLIPNGWIRI